MTQIREIADDIYSKEKTKSHHDLVVNFERHQKTIEAIDFNATQESYDIYSQLIADYGIALAETRNYKKALPQIDKALDLLLSNKKFTTDTLPKVKFYEILVFNRGVCNYYLDKYKLALPDFELLVKLYPDNTVYQNWLIASGNKKLSRMKNILWYIVAGSVLVESLLSPATLLKDVTLAVGIFALLAAIILEIMLYFRKRKGVQ